MTEKLKDRTIKYLRDAKNPKYKRSLSNILTHLNINIDNPTKKLPVFLLELVNDNILVQHNSNVSPGSNNVAPILWLEYNPYPKS